MIPIAVLAEIYSTLGFVQREDQPAVFEGRDQMMMFHHAMNGEVDPCFVIEDAMRVCEELGNNLRRAIAAKEGKLGTQ